MRPQAFGFPPALTVTAYGDDGSKIIGRREVVEVGNEEPDASLFGIPAGYTKFNPKKRSLAVRALSLLGKG